MIYPPEFPSSGDILFRDTGAENQKQMWYDLGPKHSFAALRLLLKELVYTYHKQLKMPMPLTEIIEQWILNFLDQGPLFFFATLFHYIHTYIYMHRQIHRA